MKHLGVIVGLAFLLGSSGRAKGEELTRASLAGLSRIGAVIVTVANDTVPESEVRRAAERRLAAAKITVDGDPGPELLVSVSAERDRAEAGRCECGTFRVYLSLREPVMLERIPDQRSVAAVTWQTSSRIRQFSRAAPRVTIMDTVEEGLSAFLGAVASDTQQAEHAQDRP